MTVEATGEDGQIEGGEDAIETPALEGEGVVTEELGGEPGDPGDGDPGEGEGDGDSDDAAAAASAYKPNLKFSVRGEEKEFDEWAKALVKDEESEKLMREIHEKVYGLDHVKEHRDRLDKEISEVYKPLEQKFQEHQQGMDTLSQFVRTGNYDAFFGALKIPEDQIIQWAAQRLQYQDMSPAERAAYDQRVQTGQQAVYSQQESQQYRSELDQLKHERRMFEIDQALSKPEVAESVSDYNARRGDPAAFRNLVMERGQYHWFTTKTDIPVEQAVGEALQILGVQGGGQANVLPSTGTGEAPNASSAPAAPQAPAVPPKKPTIPAVNGGGLSQVGNRVKSIDDIKRIAEARTGS